MLDRMSDEEQVRELEKQLRKKDEDGKLKQKELVNEIYSVLGLSAFYWLHLLYLLILEDNRSFCRWHQPKRRSL